MDETIVIFVSHFPVDSLYSTPCLSVPCLRVCDLDTVRVDTSWFPRKHSVLRLLRETSEGGRDTLYI